MIYVRTNECNVPFVQLVSKMRHEPNQEPSKWAVDRGKKW